VPPRPTVMSGLHAVDGDVRAALESVSVPAYVIEPSGVIRWVNRAAERLVGDVRGRQFTSVVAPEDSRRAREQFARKIVGTQKVTDASVVLLGEDGGRVDCEISSVALLDGHRIVGVFGQLADVESEPPPAPPPHLTPRQVEVLRLLQRGASTYEIARELHLSPETVRNHVRRLLRALGVHTRLEAVAWARHDSMRASA
jgi:PAS domain S-box-containing protein